MLRNGKEKRKEPRGFKFKTWKQRNKSDSETLKKSSLDGEKAEILTDPSLIALAAS